MLNSDIISRTARAVENNFNSQVSFLKDLVSTKSSNPYTPEFSDPKQPVERDVASLIAKHMKTLGCEPRMIGATPERQNVVASLGPARARRSLILNGHMDTAVPSESYRGDPYEPFVRGEKLYGLGVVDMKASLAAYVFAAKALCDLGITLGGRLMLTFVVDEEPGACSKLGTQFLLNNGVRAKAAIVAEPGTQIGIGHRGGYRFKLTTHGEAVHTGTTAWQNKEKGKNAVYDMMKVIGALQEWDLPFKSARAFAGKKPVFSFPTLISGGTAINIVPELCEAYGDVRLMPGNSDKQVKFWIEERLKKLGKVSYDLDDLLFVPAVEIDEKEEVVEAMRNSYEQLLQKRPRIEGVGPWNDGWMFITRDIPTIVQVPLESGGSHSELEWVNLASLQQFTTSLTLTVLQFLGIRKKES